MDAQQQHGIESGRWQIGPLTRAYLTNPPSGKVLPHEGRDVHTGESVGVLQLRPPWDLNRRLRNDYLHGFNLLRRLDHPHIVKVHDVIDEMDLFGLVTEPLLGDNLHRHICFGATIPTEAEVIRLMVELTSGLEHAHRNGIIFGNLKPTNVEVFPDGTAKIFALPKPPHEFTSFLDAADYLGYPRYNSPELLRCEQLDERTDIYGLGICAYEVIVSRRPERSSGNLGADLRALATEEWPSPLEIVGEIHPILNKVVMRCLHKDPAQRYVSAAEVLRDLKRVKAGSTPLVSSARLLEIVTSAFPFPLAVLAKAVERDDHLVAQKDKLLNLAHGIVAYLGFLAALGLGRPLGREYARPSLGHWIGLLRTALQGDDPVGWPLELLRKHRAGAAELLRGFNEVSRLRNRVAHSAAPEEGAILHDWVKQMSDCIRVLYKNLLPLANCSLMVVEDLDFDAGSFRVGVRRLNGVGEPGNVTHFFSGQPYTKGRVYVSPPDGSRLLPLYPWVVFARCPLCQQRELFFYVSAEEGKAQYVTVDRGHTWSCDPPSELQVMFQA